MNPRDIFVGSTIFSGIFVFFIWPIFEIPAKPELGEKWWGPGKEQKEDTSIKPFEINISDKVLKDLTERLTTSLPFQQPLENVHQQYGINTNLLQTIVKFWKTEYDWRKREKFLNKFPQFKTNIQGLNIHYLHVKPTRSKGIQILPLLLLHGWPGSFREFYEIIPYLTTLQKGRKFVFEIIAPSLPGYGFSDAAVKPGLSASHMAVIFKNLMKRLGFDKYYIQGGDWGSLIIQNMAILFPDYVLGVHSNGCFANNPRSYLKLFLGNLFPSFFTHSVKEKEKIYPLSKTFTELLLETGYLHLQATKPDTIGVALRDSPVGLLAYILEKFITWTDPTWKDLEDGGLTEKFTYTDLLDNVMIYWVTRSITTSMRLYSETFSNIERELNLDKIPVEVPSACASFYNDIIYQSESILKEKYYKLIQVTNYDGGHFAAFELPGILAKDIFTFVEKVEISQRQIN